MPLIEEDLLQVRTPLVNFHVLRDSAGLYLIDTGFIAGQQHLISSLRSEGWLNDPIKGIILTHGHLDHVLNVQSIARQHGAWIAAPRADEAHYLGRYRYRGAARVCGLLEALGRLLLRYQHFQVNTWLEDSTLLRVWDGLEAVHLPGHTDGHMGYLCRKRRLLFCGDLFASHAYLTHPPPLIFNSNSQLIQSSIERALSLDIDGILPNHGDTASPATHLRRLQRLGARLLRSTP